MKSREKDLVSERFSAELFKLRTSRGRTQREVAQAATIARSYYSELENERRCPPKDRILEKIICALNLSRSECIRLRELAIADRRLSKSLNGLSDLQTILRQLSITETLPEEKIQRIRAILEEE